MRNQLAASQIASYRADGFIAVQDFLSADELKTWREVTDQAVRQRIETGGKLSNQSNPDEYYAQVFTQCLRLADSNPAMRQLIYDRRIAQMAGELAGVSGLRIWHDQALIKPPYGNPTSWHLDNPYWSFSSRDSISIWIALMMPRWPTDGCSTFPARIGRRASIMPASARRLAGFSRSIRIG